MSDEELKQKSEVEANFKARIEYLNALASEASEKEAKLKASYHHSKEADIKADRAQSEASAEEERKDKPRLDPIELIRQLEKMRKEGFDEATIRAAFSEVMDNQVGHFRLPLRRVLKSDTMTKMPTQEEINKMYTDRYKGVIDTEVNDPSLQAIVSTIGDTEKQMVKLANPTLKQRVYRVAYFLLRPPLRFMIAFLTALRNGSDEHYT